jgi:hypothetical protein
MPPSSKATTLATNKFSSTLKKPFRLIFSVDFKGKEVKIYGNMSVREQCQLGAADQRLYCYLLLLCSDVQELSAPR